MNYPTYGHNPGFGAQRPAGAFFGGSVNAYPYIPQNAPAPQNGQMAGVFTVQPVTSREEALAVIADPMSPGVLLPDLGHGMIYVKKFNPNTGTSDFGEFAFVQPKPPVETPVETPDYLTRKEFEDALAQLRTELAPRGKRLKEVTADES